MRRVCFSVSRLCCVLVVYFPRVGLTALTTWAFFSFVDVCIEYFSSLTAALLIATQFVFWIAATTAYFRTITVGAGSPREIPGLSVPLNSIELTDQSATAPGHAVTSKENGRLRFCSKCWCWKPDRCHHCSSCRKCVLRMDHHCPWFSTCIGHRNHKFFIQFLVFASVFSLYCFVVSGCAVRMYLADEESMHKYRISFHGVLVCVLGLVLGVPVTLFAGFSIYLVLRNETTLESLEPAKYASQVPNSLYRFTEPPSSSTVGNIFDIGWRANWCEIMGSTAVEWLVPCIK